MSLNRSTTNALESMGAKHMLMATAGRLVGEMRSVLAGYPIVFGGVRQGEKYVVPMTQFSTPRQLEAGGTVTDEDPTIANIEMTADTVYHSWQMTSDAMDTDTIGNRLQAFLDQSVNVLLEGIQTKLTAQIGRDANNRSLAGAYGGANPVAAALRAKTEVDRDVLLGAKGILGKHKWGTAGRQAYLTDFQENVLMSAANFGSANVLGRSPSPLVNGSLINPNGGIQTIATPYIHNGKDNRGLGPVPVPNATTFAIDESGGINTTATTFDLKTISPARVTTAGSEVEPLHINDCILFGTERMQIVAITWKSGTTATITVVRAINNTTAASHADSAAGSVVDGYLNLFFHRDAVGIIIPPQEARSGRGGEKITVVEPRSGLSISLLNEYIDSKNYAERWMVSMNFGAKVLENASITGRRYGVWNLPTLS